VSAIEQRPAAYRTPKTERMGSVLASWLSSTDHKIIGHMYLITSFFFFLCAGVMAMLIRVQLLGPDQHFVSDQQYNELFTMHGTIMLLLFATPLFIGFSNELLPLQIGAPDVAFPRLNLLSYYLFAFGGLILLASFLAPGGAAAFGWYAYSPLTSAAYSPGVGGDLWVMGLVLSGVGTILGGVNFITTIFCMRAPGMTSCCNRTTPRRTSTSPRWRPATSASMRWANRCSARARAFEADWASLLDAIAAKADKLAVP
jgi:cytochrome c oxidase subunit 1